MDADPALTLAVRENATWCDIVCRLHRLTPQADANLWWSDRRAPSWYPDAITFDAAVSEFDVLRRIHDAPGATVKDSFSTLDLEPHGYRVLVDATWVARPPGAAASAGRATLDPVTDKFTFNAWRHAWGGPADVLVPALLRAPGVTVLGTHDGDRYRAGGVAHQTRIGGDEVVGISNAFGGIVPLAEAAAARYPDAWVVGYEHGDALTALLDGGFTALGPLRVWARDPVD